MNLDDLELHSLNIIEAPTSSGKTYFALNKLRAEKASAPEKMLYLIDTINGAFQIVNKYDDCVLREDFQYDNTAKGKKEIDTMIKGSLGPSEVPLNSKTPIMTYSGLGAALGIKDYDGFYKQFDVVVLDEAQNLIRYKDFDNDDADAKERSQLYLGRAQGAIRELVEDDHTLVVAISATPSKLEKHYDGLCHKVPVGKDIRRYEEKAIIDYGAYKAILEQEKALRHRGILYTSRVSDMKKAIEIATSLGLKANGFWSISNNNHPMDRAQEQLRLSVLVDGKIPNDLDLLVLNAASETCIKIDSKSSPINYMIIHSTEKDEQIQVRGRYCGDIDTLYVHRGKVGEHTLFFPSKYVGVPLDSEERAQIAEELHLSDGHHLWKWPNIKKELIKSGYGIKEVRKNNERYQIVMPKMVDSIYMSPLKMATCSFALSA